MPSSVIGPESAERLRADPLAVHGKFLRAGDEPFWVRGVTYGPFGSVGNGAEYPSADVVEHDFTRMAESGFNAVRTYTVPPRALLDAAARHGLRVMVGLPGDVHVAFLHDRRLRDDIERRVIAGVRACAGHPALLCYAIGNELPAPIVRWHGGRAIERWLERLHRMAKSEEPDGLFTYVNYPSTEYLELPFLDVACFNVYLEAQKSLEAYLARLHNLVGDRPLLMAEIGLDSRRNGEDEQARVLDWQVRTVSEAGCAGAFVFAWTDRWFHGGYEIEDWDFGLTRRDRSTKPALAATSDAFAALPPRPDATWPRVSAVVCSCNGAETLRDCFDGLTDLDYPDYEVIVVDDGSNDATPDIASDYPVRLIKTDNRGLASARNTALAAATGEIVAYVDDDARPDPHWLTYLVHTFRTTSHAGVGGPNIAPKGDGSVADCVANAPGGPVHVLLSDRVAEHIPGCNMAFRKEVLDTVGGFDPQFRVAGDDVDVCWRLQEHGWTLGFHPAAVVWHHRRNSVRGYWKQQRGYGKAEALLERKWPEKYNAAGHLSWTGRLYGNGLPRSPFRKRGRIHYGTWGSGSFQRLYQPNEGQLASLPLMPEWYLLIGLLASLSLLGLAWRPLLFALPLLAFAAGFVVLQALHGAARASRSWRLRALTAGLYLTQPLARLWGRARFGLTPWRRHARSRALPRPRTVSRWTEDWRSHETWVGLLEAALLAHGLPTRRGGEFDRWDLEVRGGLLSKIRVRTAVEEHGTGKQLARFRIAPLISRVFVGGAAALAGLSLVAAVSGAGLVVAVVSGLLLAFFAWAADECAAAAGSVLGALRQMEDG